MDLVIGITYPVWYWAYCIWTDLFLSGKLTKWGRFSVPFTYLFSILAFISGLFFSADPIMQLAVMIVIFIIGYIGYQIELYQTRTLCVNGFLQDLGELLCLSCNFALFGLGHPFIQS